MGLVLNGKELTDGEVQGLLQKDFPEVDWRKPQTFHLNLGWQDPLNGNQVKGPEKYSVMYKDENLVRQDGTGERISYRYFYSKREKIVGDKTVTSYMPERFIDEIAGTNFNSNLVLVVEEYNPSKLLMFLYGEECKQSPFRSGKAVYELYNKFEHLAEEGQKLNPITEALTIISGNDPVIGLTHLKAYLQHKGRRDVEKMTKSQVMGACSELLGPGFNNAESFIAAVKDSSLSIEAMVHQAKELDLVTFRETTGGRFWKYTKDFEQIEIGDILITVPKGSKEIPLLVQELRSNKALRILLERMIAAFKRKKKKPTKKQRNTPAKDKQEGVQYCVETAMDLGILQYDRRSEDGQWYLTDLNEVEEDIELFKSKSSARKTDQIKGATAYLLENYTDFKILFEALASNKESGLKKVDAKGWGTW